MPTWTPDSWRLFDGEQDPGWPDPKALQEVTKRLAALPPLIFAGEARNLKDELARASRGEAFVLQGGDCAETFSEFSADKLKNDFKIVLQMAAVLAFTSGVPTIKIGRVAGQFAKPRSNQTETVAGEVLPVYRGDMINSADTLPEARRSDPRNMERAYMQAASTLNLLRGFAKGGLPTCGRCTRGTGSSWHRAARATATRPLPRGSSGPCDSCASAVWTPRTCTRWTST